MKLLSIKARLLCICLSWALLCPNFCEARAKGEVPIQQFQLSNGMKVVLYQRAGSGSISGGWVIGLGSANEIKGQTGMAHLFEHMMFKGTHVIGTKDYAAEKSLISGLDKLHVRLRLLRQHEKKNAMEIISLVDQAKKLQHKADSLVVKNEYNKIYKKQGASNINAYTTYDHTAYYLTIPKNKLELFMWMERDRLINAVFREFYTELEVVKGERRTRIESSPLGEVNVKFNADFWRGTPYQWPVIGYLDDLNAMTKQHAKTFFNYYNPQNITLVLVGDFSVKNALDLAQRYFGNIPAGTTVPTLKVSLPKHHSSMRMIAHAHTSPTVYVRFYTVPGGEKDEYALDVMSQILDSPYGLMKKKLEHQWKVATTTSAYSYLLKYAGYFQLTAQTGTNAGLPKLEQRLFQLIDSVKSGAITAAELKRAKKNLVATFYRNFDSNETLLRMLFYAAGQANLDSFKHYVQAINAVTLDDLQRVAAHYFSRNNSYVLLVERKKSTSI